METNYKPAGYWDIKENCKKHVELCDYNFKLFREKYSRGYKSLIDNQWLDEFFPDRKKFNFWNTQSKSQIFEKSKEYKTPTEFHSHCKEAYDISKENGWLEEFYVVRRVLSYKKCQEVVSMYNTYSELYQSDPAIIDKIRRKGWEGLLSHWEMPHSQKNPKWTYEKCKEEV
jgi:hypothetical protein